VGMVISVLQIGDIIRGEHGVNRCFSLFNLRGFYKLRWPRK